MSKLPSLPVPVLDGPHWRVVFRPSIFVDNKIQSISRLKEIVEQNQVRLRGWYFPHMGRPENQGAGNNWIASWSESGGHLEYWRLFQSSQFIYLSSVREKTEKEWDTKLRKEFRPHLPRLNDGRMGEIPGFFSIPNFIYTITEFFEFASRLCQAGVYTETFGVTVELKNIKGFALTADSSRAWFNLYQATEYELGNMWQFEPAELIAKSNEASLNTIIWFFERFGWMDLNSEVLRNDQENFLTGRL